MLMGACVHFCQQGGAASISGGEATFDSCQIYSNSATYVRAMAFMSRAPQHDVPQIWYREVAYASNKHCLP